MPYLWVVYCRTQVINKIFKDEEVDKKSNMQKMHIANSDKPVKF